MQYWINVKADYNHGDYLEKTTLISESDLFNIKPVIAAIKERDKTKSKDYNFPYSHLLIDDPADLYVGVGVTEEQVELFCKYVPNFEHGIHSIESVTLFKVVEAEVLL